MAETPILWPFPASGEIVEVLEWRTDVLQARSAEQRIALRPRPRTLVTLRHRLDALGLARAAALALAGFVGPWDVPLWQQAVQPASALQPGDGAILIDGSTAAFTGADHAALAIDGGPATQLALAAVEPDRLVLAGSLELPDATVAAARATVLPVRTGQLATAVDVSRRRQGDGTVTTTFLLQDSHQLPDPELPSYLGRPVLTDPSVLRQPLAASLRQAVAYVDNGFGPVVLEPLRDLVEHRETITLRAQGPAARARLLGWLHSLRGRQASFWLPSWGRELQPTTAASAGANLLRVAPVGSVDDWLGRAIALELPGGLAFHGIVAAFAVAGEHHLTLSGSLAAAITSTTPIHLMTLVRADADRIEVRHGAVASEVSLPVVEVPA